MFNIIVSKLIVYIDVFCTHVQNRIVNKGNAALIVCMDYSSTSLREVKCLK